MLPQVPFVSERTPNSSLSYSFRCEPQGFGCLKATSSVTPSAIVRETAYRMRPYAVALRRPTRPWEGCPASWGMHVRSTTDRLGGKDLLRANYNTKWSTVQPPD